MSIDPKEINSEVSDKYDLAGNTFSEVIKPDPLDKVDLEIGDAKQPDEFIPQIKVKRWDNEVNVSLRLVNDETNPKVETEGEKIKWIGDKVEAHFYDVKDGAPVVHQNLRVIEPTGIDAIGQSAIYELPRHVIPKKPTLFVFSPTEKMFVAGSLTPLANYLDVDKLTRSKSRLFTSSESTGGLLMEPSAIFFFFAAHKDQQNVDVALREAIAEACQDLGIETKLESNDVLFKLRGKWKKFCGTLQHQWGDWVIHAPAVTIDFNAAEAAEIYGSDISDAVGGLREALPGLDSDQFKQAVIAKIAAKLSLTAEPDSFTPEEETALQNSRTILSDEQWLTNGIRNDFNDLMPPIKEDEEGASEFEVVLKEKPVTNKVEFSLNTKGLEFRHQPPLTQAQIAKGQRRPINVVGSFAVYALEQKINWKGGKKYKCNKVGHLFYPYLIDANGWKVRAEDFIVNANPDGTGLLTVVIPQEFLDNAVYPIRHAAGLTFGYTSGGTTGNVAIAFQATDNCDRVGTAVVGVAGTLTSLHAYLGPITGGDDTIDTSMHLNEEDTGANSHDQVAEVEILELDYYLAGPDWVVFTAAGETLEAIDYIISIVGNGADVTGKGSYYGTRFDSGGASVNKYNERVSNGYAQLRDEDPWTEAEAADTDQYSLYATYEEAGGEPTPVDITKGLVYSVLTDSDIQKGLDYEVLTDTDVTKGLDYEVVGSLDITKGLAYTVITQAEVTKGLDYLVNLQAEIQRALAYTVIAAVDITKGLDYRVKTVPSEITKGLEYHVVEPNEITKGLEYDIINWWEPAALTETLGSITSGKLTDIYEEGGASLVLAETASTGGDPAFLYDFDFYGVANGGEEYAAHIHAKYTGSPSHRIKLQQWNFNTLGWENVTSNMSDFPYNADIQEYAYGLLTGADYFDNGNVRLRIRHDLGNGNVTHTFVLDHFILEFRRELTRVLNYEVLAPVDITKALKYTVITTPTKIDKALVYVVVIPADITKALAYEVTAEIGITKGLDYTVFTVSEITKGLDYLVVEFTDITKGLDYFVETETDITKGLAYEVESQVEITKDLDYRVIIEDEITKGLDYEVVAQVEMVRDCDYFVIEPIDITKTLHYVVDFSEVREITKTLDYQVATIQAINKVAEYIVVVQTDITKTLEYIVNVEQDIQKGLIYLVISTTAAIEKNLTYYVRVDPYCPKTSPYSKLDDPYSEKNSPFTKLPTKC